MKKMNIVAVGMLDHEVFGRETFFVQTGDDAVELYEVTTKGAVKALVEGSAPGRFVAASIEKFANMYRCDAPVPIQALSELPAYIGRFEISDPTTVRLRPSSVPHR